MKDHVQISTLHLPDKLPEGFTQTAKGGLTEEEAARRAALGLGNQMQADGGKSTSEILSENLFNFFNFLNVALAICLLLVGSYRNMLFMGVILSNALIGTYQEFRARKIIRRMQLLSAPQVCVLREGKEKLIDPNQVVQGDLIVLRAGDQIIADAIVMEGTGAAMESLLTGESDPIPKQKDSWLYSGSYLHEGKVTAQLVYVADQSYVGQLMHAARKVKRPKSTLMSDLNQIIRLDSIILIPLGILLFIKQYYFQRFPLTTAVPTSVAAMIGMIPEGLILLTSVALAVGVIKLSRHQTLAQELFGIEALARVDVLCLDKTGTITTGDMTMTDCCPVDVNETEFKRQLSRFLGAFDDSSDTLRAIMEQVPPANEKPVAVLPFSSKRKKSAASFSDGVTLIVGAPSFVLGEHFPQALRETLDNLAAQGKRVTVLAEAAGAVSEKDAPPVTKILGYCVMADTIRPNAAETISYFKEQGVALKVISGDNPRTVSRIARAVGLEGWDQWVDVSVLPDDAALEEASEQYTVFGRVLPAQKQKLVEALKRKGHTVAMTGDGVNDIPALKTADCSIAMAAGADATRHAAQLVLLDSDFSNLPMVVLEGRRVVNNVTRSASLFLTKTLYSFILALVTLLLPSAYPFQPIQLSLISTLTTGVPSVLLTLEPNNERIRGNFLRTVLTRAIPGGLAVAICSAIAMVMKNHGWTQEACSTIATYIAGAMSLLVLLRTCLPLNPLRVAIAAGMAAAFVGAVLVLGSLFLLIPLSGQQWLLTVGLIALGAGIQLAAAWVCKKKKLTN